MDKKIRLIAMDLDGTLTQHKEPLTAENRRALEALSEKYQLVMVGAGGCRRIFEQLGRFPIDVIGNYGLQYARYDSERGDIVLMRDVSFPADRDSIDGRVRALRQRHSYTAFRGESVEYHASGCVTLPLLGTRAIQADKLAFDPDRKKRRAFYREVVETFSEYNVFIGGSSSFDMSPRPYDKAYALDLYCKEHGIEHSEVIYLGDDYGRGGNDESVYKADFNYIEVDDYREFPALVSFLLD